MTISKFMHILAVFVPGGLFIFAIWLAVNLCREHNARAGEAVARA